MLHGYERSGSLEEKLEELKKQGAKIYSYSRLGTIENCEYEYYNTYIKGDRGIDNVYTLLGSLIHQGIEDIYSDKSDISKFKKAYDNKLMELEMLGINFPSEKIAYSWKKDVGHFVNNFNKIDKKMLLEKLFLIEIDDGVWIQGYIDAILPSDQGKPYVDVYDWKSSSKFAGSKLQEAGRQLLLYKLGVEDNTNLKVDKVMWFMVKYIYVCNTQKNGKIKKKMCNRGKWVKEIKNPLEKALGELGIDDFELEMMMDKAIEDNNLKGLPQDIQDMFWLEDCIVEYDTSDENMNELKQYIRNTINKIESKDPNNEDDWTPVDINKSNSFYCSVLCGHRRTCKYYKQFLKDNADNFDKKEKRDEFDIFN
jgi:hypothetical protein